MSCDADLLANTLLPSLTSDANISIPPITIDDSKYQLPVTTASQLYGTIKSAKIEDVTTKEIDGSGSFDVMMSSIKQHLYQEYDQGRITGAEYTKAYTDLVQSALQQSITFVLEKDRQFWTNQLAQIQAIQGVIALDQAKIDLARLNIEAYTVKTKYANEKLNLSLLDQQYCKAVFETEQLLPSQKDQIDAQTGLTEAQKDTQLVSTDIESYRLNSMLPKEASLLEANKDLVVAQKAGQEAKTSIDQYTKSDMLPAQKDLVIAQKNVQISQKDLIDSQVLGQDAKTAIDGYQLSDMLPKQKDLVIAQTSKTDADKAQVLFTTAQVLPAQVNLITAQVASEGSKKALTDQQKLLVEEQTSVQEAQHTGTPGGYIGKQMELYDAQIQAFADDTTVKKANVVASIINTNTTVSGETRAETFPNV